MAGAGDAEAEHHWSELRRASELVLATFPDVEVVPHLINFEGFWEAEETAQGKESAAD